MSEVYCCNYCAGRVPFEVPADEIGAAIMLAHLLEEHQIDAGKDEDPPADQDFEDHLTEFMDENDELLRRLGE